jgi:formylmethanofuran dehydrogenase subunit E
MDKEILSEKTRCTLCGRMMFKGREVNCIDGELFCDNCLEDMNEDMAYKKNEI